MPNTSANLIVWTSLGLIGAGLGGVSIALTTPAPVALSGAALVIAAVIALAWHSRTQQRHTAGRLAEYERNAVMLDDKLR